MKSIVYSKFAQNDDIKMKLIKTNDMPLYECTSNRWWGAGLKIDAPEWETGNCPGQNNGDYPHGGTKSHEKNSEQGRCLAEVARRDHQIYRKV